MIQPLILGHRGASRNFPENTLASFRAALAAGADGIELDLQRCKTGELVVIHDDSVDRTTSARGKVSRFTAEALQELWIPTLPQLFDALGQECHYYLEIKDPDTALQAAGIAESYIRQGWAREKIRLISFHHACLYAVRQQFPLILTGASFDTRDEDWIKTASSIQAQEIIVFHPLLDPDIIHQAHTAGLQVIAWTVNHAADIHTLSAMGVDGIMTDVPERFTLSSPALLPQ